MYGQYRSEVECRNCQHKSLTFDPYLMLTLPIPSKDQLSVEIYFLAYEDGSAYKMKIFLNEKVTYRDAKEELGKILKINAELLLLADVSNSVIKQLLNDDDKVQKNEILYAFQLREFTQDESLIELNFYKESSYISFGSSCSIGYPRILIVPKDCRLDQLHVLIFAYISKVCVSQHTQNSEDYFRENFSSLFGGKNTDTYILRLININHRKSSFTMNLPCPYCSSQNCENCNLPFTEEPLENYINKSKNNFLNLQILFPRNTDIKTSIFGSVEIHESNSESNKFVQKQNQCEITLEDCLRTFSTPEKLDQNNTTFCSNCKNHTLSIKKMDIYRLPKILIIHLKRFKHQGTYNSKNNKTVVFPIDGLDMSKYVNVGEWIYDLFAVSNHFGSLGGGHYTAYAKNHDDSRWYEFDDSRVSNMTSPASSIISSNAYVLFYGLREN